MLQLKVLFVDYGNYDFIDVTHLRPLSEEYTQLKLQAVRAGLYSKYSLSNYMHSQVCMAWCVFNVFCLFSGIADSWQHMLLSAAYTV